MPKRIEKGIINLHLIFHNVRRSAKYVGSLVWRREKEC